jgi:predicted nucleic acid-binding protein
VILVDTTPLVALCDGRDSRHRSATKELQRFGVTELCTCEAVLVEACFHLPHRAQRQRLHAMLDQFDIGSVSGTDEDGFWVDVFAWLLKYAEHEPDWADGCLAVLCGRDKRLKVWTYDREFRTTWRRPDGTPIPLAGR